MRIGSSLFLKQEKVGFALALSERGQLWIDMMDDPFQAHKTDIGVVISLAGSHNADATHAVFGLPVTIYGCHADHWSVGKQQNLVLITPADRVGVLELGKEQGLTLIQKYSR